MTRSSFGGRSFFQSISAVVDEIFNDYIRRQGFVEPLSAKFCNGTTSTCDGLSQWGSQAMAEQAPTPSPSCETIMATISRS